MLKRALILGAALAALVAGPARAANTWFVSPHGSGTDCTSTSPCPFAYGVGSKPSSGDDVDVTDGDYTVGPGVTIPEGVTVHGSNPAFVHVTLTNTGESDGITVRKAAFLRGMSIVNESGGGALTLGYNNSIVSELDVRTTTGPAAFYGSTGASAVVYVRNVLLLSTAGDGMHVGSMSATNTIALEDSTIVGGTHALEAATFASGDDIEADNTILHALAGSHAVTLSGQPGQNLQFHSLNSNYPAIGAADKTNATTTETAHQSDSPAFVAETADLATANFREATGSPTIDAGSNAAAAGITVDLAGQARKLGTAVDIGAYEYYPPPTVTTAAATDVTTTAATLRGVVDGHGFGSSVSFVYGPTTAYEAPPPDAILLDPSASPQPVSLRVTGLAPGTTYHFTLSAVSGPAFGQGTDLTFTTLPLPGGGSGPGGGPGPGQGSDPRPGARCVVPKLKGKTLAAARKALRKAGCALGKVRKPKHGHGKLVVARQRVKPRTSVAAGTKVGVTLAHKRPRHRRR